MSVTFRPHQLEAVDAIENAFRAGIMRPAVNMSVGSGKSLLGAECGRREIERGGRVLSVVHTRELVEQNAAAYRLLGIQCGINAASLGERTWRAPAISAAIQSVYKNAQSFGPITMLIVDECHLIPHSEAGMYRELHRALGYPRMVGLSGTTFRLQGGSLVEGEGAPFEKIVYTYDIIDGIRDGYLVPAFSAPADDKIDLTKLKVRQGEYTPASQDEQMIAAIDNHIVQMIHHGRDRRAWLVFEASVKAAKAMAARLNEWGIPTGLVLGETAAGERAATIQAFTGFDVQEVDLLVLRRATKSLGLYIQMTGRLLRTVGGNIVASVRAGKADGLVLDFAGLIDTHGPLDFIHPKETALKLTSCECCGARNPTAAANCWSCSEPMTKNCPLCLEAIRKYELDCPHCGFDMRQGPRDEAKPQKLLDTPSGAALIAAYKTGAERQGGWLPIMRVFGRSDVETIVATPDGTQYTITGALAAHGRAARWLRTNETGTVTGVLVPNGASRKSVLQITSDGISLIVPMPVAIESEAA